MSRANLRLLLLLILVGAVATLGSCFAEPNGAQGSGGKHAMLASGGSGTETTGGTSEGGEGAQCFARAAVKGASCHPVKSAEPLYAKVVKDEPQDTVVFVDDLFTQFKSHCGACHVDSNLGDPPFQATAVNFYQTVGQRALDAIRSSIEFCDPGAKDCLNFMPPRAANGKSWSEREKDATDPIRFFADELESWLASKKPGDDYPPADVFILPASKGGKSPYPVSEEVAQAQTNLGTCIPDAGMVATEPTKACDLDATFAAMKRDPMSATLDGRIGLPLSLQQTDLFTLDTAELATYGVVAYQPTYPLWTDDAGKLRYIRVPRGQSVTYDKQSKQFVIPENTRFYKTFMKKVKALDGTERYRKIETRVIVSRKGTDSLYGSYEWNDGETQATLVTSPLRSGAPFTDVLKTLVIDEPTAAMVQQEKDAGTVTNLTYELDQQHAVRRYAIPGSDRCVQCHMGNESFILGFRPLQINRRPCDQATLDAKGSCDGGILSAAGDDELTQVQRLIDYGVITGMDPKDFPKLEDAQGPADAPRNVRTPQELLAQGYMLGNCSHCHNPIGYPSTINPELKDLLDFLPSEHGGIFEFPLERYSPRIKRGAGADVQLPYITPSLYDIWPAGDPLVAKWTPKSVASTTAGGQSQLDFIIAPWRSLIYRNVDTPFTYTDNYAIYPHMPLNSPGFDCRVPRILGDWMVSIPAVKKDLLLFEDRQAGSVLPHDPQSYADSQSQPYKEVKPGEMYYSVAQAQAKQRLQQYHDGDRYQSYCPDTRDIIDLDVLRGKRQTPIDGSYVIGNTLVVPREGVPDHPHWVVTDLTDPPGDWSPRRTDWHDVLVDQKVPDLTLGPSDAGYQEAKQRHDNQIPLVAMLQDIRITDDFKAFALKPRPFGFWETKGHQCGDQLAKVSVFGDYQSGKAHFAERERWMDDPDFKDLQAPVYEATPGQAVFNMICVNCHGPNADSQGRQATTLQDMTGGNARVANFRDGLFGPTGSGGANRHRVFGEDDVVASHYLPWMALGGTNAKIPQAILDLVTQTPVLGVGRVLNAAITSANMLQVAQELCKGVALFGTGQEAVKAASLSDYSTWQQLAEGASLIPVNGDAELWRDLCTLNNPAPVHVLRATLLDGGRPPLLQGAELDLYQPTKYPAATPIGDLTGAVAAQLTPDNAFPWCVIAPDAETAAALVAASLPQCPDAFLVDDNRLHYDYVSGTYSYPDVDLWAMRGAVNAGLSVFVYLDWLVSQDHPIPPRFNECEQLK